MDVLLASQVEDSRGKQQLPSFPHLLPPVSQRVGAASLDGWINRDRRTITRDGAEATNEKVYTAHASCPTITELCHPGDCGAKGTGSHVEIKIPHPGRREQRNLMGGVEDLNVLRQSLLAQDTVRAEEKVL